MKGTLFSADFVKDSSGNLRLLELNTDTGILTQEAPNFDFTLINQVLLDNNISELDIIYKPGIHSVFVNEFSASVSNNVINVTTLNLHEEDVNTIYPTQVEDSTNKFILRLAYDESALFDSEYCKTRLNVFNLFTENSITDYCVAYYHSSSLGEYNTLTKEINPSNLPDVTIKDIDEHFNPIDFFKIGSENENESIEDRWNNFLSENISNDKLIEQYHFHSSSVDENNHINSIRFFGIVYGSDLEVIPLHSYKISSIFDLPTDISSEINENVYTNKIADHHYYEYTTNFIKNDSNGLLSTQKILDEGDNWKLIGDFQVGDYVKSYYIDRYDASNSDALYWTYDGNQFPSGSYITSSSVIYKNSENLKYNSMFELKVDGDSFFSGLAKTYIVFDSGSNTSLFKSIILIDPSNDYLYGLNGNNVSIDELNFYVSTDTNLNFIELDVEDTDTFIISGSTPFNSIVAHNAPCFVAGTQILLEDGTTKNIEDVVIGENIVSFDLKNHESKISKVLNIFSKKVEKIVEYEFLNGGKLKATLDHPIFVIDKGWCSYSSELSNSLYNLDTPIKTIEIGDIVKLYESEDKIVKIDIIEESTTVYNLSEIKTFHNYFANNVLVHNRCFVAGTKITLSDGTYKNIEEISIGESVLTFNEKLNTTQTGTVGDVKSHTVNQLIEIIFEDSISITTTPEHPFYVKHIGYVEAKNLYVDCICVKDDMSELKIQEIIQHEKECNVYNLLSVTENHNFFANGILTHNKSCFISGTKVLISDGSEKNIEDIIIGDEVLSYNEQTAVIEPKKVIKLNSPVHDDLVEYTLSNGIKITSTFDHPYYVNGLHLASYQPNWTNERYDLPSEVDKIKVGDFVNLANRQTEEIISIVELDRVDTQTYIISVEDNRNFYANQILVHNK
jgi:intein/homing endonuclease